MANEPLPDAAVFKPTRGFMSAPHNAAMSHHAGSLRRPLIRRTR